MGGRREGGGGGGGGEGRGKWEGGREEIKKGEFCMWMDEHEARS